MGLPCANGAPSTPTALHREGWQSPQTVMANLPAQNDKPDLKISQWIRDGAVSRKSLIQLLIKQEGAW